MTEFMNERAEIIQMRKSRSTLKICGKGVLILVVWTIVRFLLSSFMNDDSVAFFEQEYISSGAGSAWLYWTIFLILVLILLSVYVFVCFSAIAEANGKKKGYFYLLVCFAILCGSVYSIFDSLTTVRAYVSRLDAYVSVLFDIVRIIVSIGVLSNSIQIKKLRKSLGEEDQ